MRSRSLLFMVFALALMSFAVTGCGDDKTDNASGAADTSAATGAADEQAPSQDEAAKSGGETVSFTADASGALKYAETAVTAKAGDVTIELANDSSVPHDVVIEQGGKEIAKTEEVSGSTVTAKATLKKGAYEFYCSVPGHKDAGMKGTLTVK